MDDIFNIGPMVGPPPWYAIDTHTVTVPRYTHQWTHKEWSVSIPVRTQSPEAKPAKLVDHDHIWNMIVLAAEASRYE